jgi:hypothetical protein
MEKINNGIKDNYLPIIAIGLALGFAYACYGALYLSSSGLINNIPPPMSLLIFSIVPVYYIIVPAIAAFSSIMIIYITAQRLFGKRTYSRKLQMYYFLILSLCVGFLLAVHSIPK